MMYNTQQKRFRTVAYMHARAPPHQARQLLAVPVPVLRVLISESLTRPNSPVPCRDLEPKSEEVLQAPSDAMRCAQTESAQHGRVVLSHDYAMHNTVGR